MNDWGLKVSQISTHGKQLFNNITHVKAHHTGQHMKSSYPLYYPLDVNSGLSYVLRPRALGCSKLRPATTLEIGDDGLDSEPFELLGDSKTTVSHHF